MRQYFDLPDDVVYLNSAFMGLQPKPATEAAIAAVVKKERPWEMGPSVFFESSEELRKQVARLLHTKPDLVSLVPSVSFGVETATRILQPKKTILVPEGDFPSNIYPWYQYAKTNKVAIERVKKGPQGWTESFLKAITSETGLVSVPQSDWSTGELFDLGKLSEKIKSVGARWIVDVSQSFGAVPIHIPDFEPDILCSVGYKWQLGPYGLSYLYLNEKYLDHEPLDNNWLNRKNSQNFSTLTDYQFEFQQGARRFDSGGRSQVSVPAALTALRMLGDFNLQKIAAHIYQLTEHLTEQLLKLDLEIEGPISRRHILGMKLPQNLDPQALVQRLTSEKCYVSLRGPHLRLSPHLYNQRQDIDQFVDILSSAMGRPRKGIVSRNVN